MQTEDQVKVHIQSNQSNLTQPQIIDAKESKEGKEAKETKEAKDNKEIKDSKEAEKSRLKELIENIHRYPSLYMSNVLSAEREDQEISEIAKAIEESKVCCEIVCTKHKLSKKQQQILLNAILNKKSVARLQLNGFALTEDNFVKISKLSQLYRLYLSGLKACDSFTDKHLQLFSDMPSLIQLSLRFEEIVEGRFGLSVLFFQCPVSELGEHFQISIKGLNSILLGKSPIRELHMPDCRLKQSDVAILEQGLKANQHIEFISLPDSIALSRNQQDTNFTCLEYFARNYEKRRPSDKIRYEVNGKGQRMMQMSRSLTGKMFDLLETLRGTALHEALRQINFDPNGLMHDCPDNPLINSLIANEDYQAAVTLILEFPELFPNVRDHEGKPALITAAKVFAGDEVIRALLDTFGNKLDLDAQDEDGCTALHFLCAYGKMDLARRLVAMGARTDLKDRLGRLPKDCTSLTIDELTGFLNSIHVHAGRDENTSLNGFGFLINQLYQDFKDFVKSNFELEAEDISNLALGTLGNLNLFIQYVKSKEFLTKHSSQEQETLLEKCLKIKPRLVGRSILQACLIEREQVRSFLESLQVKGLQSSQGLEIFNKTTQKASSSQNTETVPRRSFLPGYNRTKAVFGCAAVTALGLGLKIGTGIVFGKKN